MTSSTWVDEGLEWRFGAWSFENRGDEIADLTRHGRRVLRSIRAVVRDRDWNTAEWSIGDPVEGEGTLRLPLASAGYGSDIRGELVVRARGESLSIEFDAVSHKAFATNRTGLVVLHPPEAAGATLRVLHSDGSLSETSFPVAISAHQPVLDIAALAWVDDGAEITVDFSGDVFEMEDQRNWTDASFKTYSRPLALPFPYELGGGEAVRQRIDVSTRAVGEDAAAQPPTSVTLSAGGTYPTVCVSASTARDPEPAGLVRMGGELLVELDLDSPVWAAALRRAAGRGRTLDVRAVLREPDSEVLGLFANALRGLDVARVAVFDPVLHVSGAGHVESLRAALAATGIEADVVGGSRSHFTELNREGTRLPDDLAGIVTTVTPLFHSLSTAQLIESIAMQRLVARQTVAYAGHRPVRIGPVTLRPRYNNVATAAPPAPTRSDLAEGYGAEFTGSVDARQRTDELAAWTIASAAALAIPGVSGLVYFEEWGPRGIRDVDGTPYPVADAIDALARLAGAVLLSGDSPDGLVWALGAQQNRHVTVLVANLDRVERTVTIDVHGQGAEITASVTLPPLCWTQVEPAGPH